MKENGEMKMESNKEETKRKWGRKKAKGRRRGRMEEEIKEEECGLRDGRRTGHKSSRSCSLHRPGARIVHVPPPNSVSFITSSQHQFPQTQVNQGTADVAISTALRSTVMN
jgi:hypothetical protein